MATLWAALNFWIQKVDIASLHLQTPQHLLAEISASTKFWEISSSLVRPFDIHILTHFVLTRFFKFLMAILISHQSDQMTWKVIMIICFINL